MGTMATVAIGDIHGNLSALEELLAKIMPTMGQDDVLVFLGDYIDRGPDTRGCLERIVRLKEQAKCAVVTLLGNHEDWMLKTFRDPTSHSWVLGMEAFETIASYSPDAAETLRHELECAGMRLITERVRIRYEVFFDLVPPRHLEFLKSLTLYHRTPDVVCVHGGIRDDRPLNLHDPETLLWGPDGFPEGYHGQEAVVYGHWDNSVINETGRPGPCVKANGTFGIDTISRGVLTAMRFPDSQVIQSGQGIAGNCPGSRKRFGHAAS
jgi:serine/threonine protein phosphatase 1